MDSFNRIQFTIFILFTLLLKNDLKAQDVDCKLSMNGHIVKSRVNHKSYQLYISLPSDYNKNNKTTYPVLYLLDAYYSYPLIKSIHGILDMGNEIEKIIIVAIGDEEQNTQTWTKSRMIDYTLSNDPIVDSEIANSLGVPVTDIKTGGAKDFLATIRKDIIPYIDSHYKTSNDRGISGHSVGGLFSSYCLLNASDLFKRFGINSPSLFWNKQEIISAERDFAIKNSYLNAKVFISNGSLEPEIITSSTDLFIKELKKHQYKDFSLTSQIFENETHTSVVAASTSRTLKVLYEKK